eukprot:scaffold5520_cov74-Phaeocystis_antarctica.AAC.3
MACAWRVHGVCRLCAWRVHGVRMLRALLQRSARVLDRVVRVLQPVGHLLTKQVPREEAQRDAAGARQGRTEAASCRPSPEALGAAEEGAPGCAGAGAPWGLREGGRAGRWGAAVARRARSREA